MRYTSRGLRRRRDTDKWEVILSHKDPVTGKAVTTYHTIEAKTEKQAQKKRNELMLELERKRSAINALDQEERTRMLRLAREAQPQLLGYIVEVALTTGLRRGEICTLHASDLLNYKTLMVRRSLGNGQGGYYEKEPKTESSVRVLHWKHNKQGGVPERHGFLRAP